MSTRTPIWSRVTVGSDRDRGSIVLSMLLVLIGTSVAALILPVLLGQTSATTFDARRTRQLAAAQSGIEVALARIRAANDGQGAGLIGSLPCITMLGNVVGSTNLRYQVSMSYYASDPSQMTPAQLLNIIPCVAGAGTKVTPAYVMLTSQGTDVATGSMSSVPSRTVMATYVVQTTNAHIVGGLFHVYKTSTSKDLCLDAGSSNPPSGTVVTMQPCDSTNLGQQFAYNPNLTVSLVPSQTSANTLGMCLDGAATPEVSGTALRFQPCAVVTSARQQWSMNDSAGMQGTDNGATLNALCWAVQSPNVPGSQVVLGTTCSAPGSQYDNQYSWQPAAAVGAGASGAANNELVNYYEFGRCLDVTNQNVTSSYLIAWPCKQSPNPANVAWNQKWALPATVNGSGTGAIVTTKSPTAYCLVSPLSSAAGKYVTVQPCPNGTKPASMTWTVRTQAATYASSYQIIDSAGLCLQPTDPTATPPDFAVEGNGISKIGVQPCSAATLQKWNAPPNLGAPTVENQHER